MTHVVTSRLVPLAKSKAQCGSVCCSTVRIRPEEFGVESTENLCAANTEPRVQLNLSKGKEIRGLAIEIRSIFSFLLRNLRLDDAA